MQGEMLARLNELMHSLLEMTPLLQAARRADELPQPVRDLLHGLTGYAGLAVQPLSMFVEYQRDLADQMARWPGCSASSPSRWRRGPSASGSSRTRWPCC
ncbi:MAG: hypothetical protein ACM3ZF_00135 [Mycobacterium leprae]